MNEKEYTPPPLPKSAPIQSELTNSTKQKRIPQKSTKLYQISTKESNSNSNITTKHKQLPELQTNSKLFQIPNFKNTPVNESYRHNKNLSIDGGSGSGSGIGSGSGSGNDKKRLVDQFYDQFGTPPPSSSSAGNTKLNTPLLTRNNTATSLGNDSRTNLVFNKFEFDNDKNNGIGGIGYRSEIGDEISKLEQIIVKRIKEQVEINEDEFLEKIDDFQLIQQDIQNIKNKIQEIIKEIKFEKINNFNLKFNSFENDINKFLSFLKILQDYETKLNNSRNRMNEYKKKLYDIRKSIEFGEQMKIIQHEKTENRNKWIGFAFLISFVVFIYIKIKS